MTNAEAASPPPNLFAFASTLAILAMSIYFLVIGKDVFIPLVMGIFIAYLIVALAHTIERVRIGSFRPHGWVSMTCSIVLFLLGLAALVQLIAGNIGDAMGAAQQYQVRLEEVLGQINDFLASAFNRRERLTLTGILEQIDLRSLASRFATALEIVVGNTFEILIYVVFVLLEQRAFDHKLTAMFPDPARQRALRHTLTEIGRRTEKYVLIKTLVSLLIGATTYICLHSLSIDFAGFLSLLAFLANYIPYLGSAIGVGLPAIFALLQTGSLGLLAVIAGVLGGTHTLIGNVMEPRLMGRSLNISPLLMIVALAAWGTMWGVAGMLLSVPIMVMTMITLAQFPSTRPIAVFMSADGNI